MKAPQILLSCGLLAAAIASRSQQTPPVSGGKGDLTDIPLQDLMKIDVTDAFKTPMPLMEVPAAFYVVTREDIERNGATNIPEALRQVPGVTVSREGSVYYSVTIRGFAAAPSNKLLVLLDGRTLYSPYQNGVYWEIEDVPIQDVDRIEVIRGPGGSLWGANAVNGVINIVTRNSHETKGGLISQLIGTLQPNQSLFRYGGDIGEIGAFRFFGKYGAQGQSQNADGSPGGDDESLSTAGLRADFDLGNQNTLLLESALGRYFIAESQQVPLVTPPYSLTTALTDSVTTSDVLARWEHQSPSGAHSSAQLYYDLIDYPYTNQSSTGTTYDLDLEHRFANFGAHSVSVGGGYRYLLNDSTPGPSQTLVPKLRKDTVFSTYAQDDWATTPVTHLTVGCKLEHNDYSGFEVEPNVRFAFAPDPNHTLWAAVGRAVRTPSQSEANIFALGSVTPPVNGQGLPVATANVGNPNLSSERLIANEIGYRAQVTPKLYADIATFYNIYDNLIYLSPGNPFNTTIFGPNITVDPNYYENGGRGNTYGLEASSKLNLESNLRAEFGFSFIRHSHFTEKVEMGVPRYQASANLYWDPIPKFEVNGVAHWYDHIRHLDVPGYTKVDLILNWKPSHSFNLSVGGYDLLTPNHAEFGSVVDQVSDALDATGYIPRSLVISATYKF